MNTYAVNVFVECRESLVYCVEALPVNKMRMVSKLKQD